MLKEGSGHVKEGEGSCLPVIKGGLDHDKI